MEEAIDRVIAGPERKTAGDERQGEAGHRLPRGGHALVGHVLPHADPIHKVSIVARSRSLGLTFTLPEDKYNHSRSELRDAMAMCLGRAHRRGAGLRRADHRRRKRHREGDRASPGPWSPSTA